MFTAGKLAMNRDHREVFAAFETTEGRLDWLKRTHDEMKKQKCDVLSICYHSSTTVYYLFVGDYLLSFENQCVLFMIIVKLCIC